MSELNEALTRSLLEITRIQSPIGEERALCDHVQQRLLRTLPAEAVTRYEDSLVVRINHREGAPRIALVGHLDVVRTEHDGPARIEGERLYGAGAADMKSGLAIMLELIERLDRDALGCELSAVFYEREEGPFEENMLGPMLRDLPELSTFDLAICLEPSDNRLQLGCMGSMHATVRFQGQTAHSARPWQGDNAITKAATVLADLGALAPRDVVVDGFTFREVMSPTLAKGGRGRNVVPDTFELNINARFAPGRTPQDAVADLERLVDGRASVEPTDLSPSGRPHKDHPLVRKLAEAGVRSVEPKQAWTDVARFDAIGVPAVNFGPGNNAQAHQRNEYTELPLLHEGYGIFERFLTSF